MIQLVFNYWPTKMKLSSKQRLKRFQFSSLKMTVLVVDISSGKIIDGAPIIRKFVGQP